MACRLSTAKLVRAVVWCTPGGPGLRRDLHLDFGSIDYFVVDGEAVVVDANKTTTCSDD